ncbi:hypothetical protein WAI453_005564 [Rhynchosporium graminicola]
MSSFLGARSNLLCPMLMDNPFPAPLLPRCDLLACAEDITDTWGQLVTVSDKSSSSKKTFLTFQLIGVLESCHQLLQDLLVQIQSYSLVQRQSLFTYHVPFGMMQRWKMCSEYLENIGPSSSASSVAEWQPGLQGNQFVNFQFNQTWVEPPAIHLSKNNRIYQRIISYHSCNLVGEFKEA